MRSVTSASIETGEESVLDARHITLHDRCTGPRTIISPPGFSSGEGEELGGTEGDRGTVWKAEDCGNFGAASVATGQAVGFKEGVNSGDNSSTRSGNCPLCACGMLSSLSALADRV